MNKFPKINTDRLILRELAAKDIPSIIQTVGDIEITKTTTNIPYPYQESDAIFWINMAHQGFAEGKLIIWGIELKSNGEFIGGIELFFNARFNRAEVGYWIGKNYWNKGYCSEALKEVLKYGFEKSELNRIYATHFAENDSSGRVMQKCKMLKEGVLKQHILKDEKYIDLVYYGITKDQFMD